MRLRQPLFRGIAILVSAVLVSWLVLSVGIANVVGTRNPALAMGWAAYDGRVLAAQAGHLLQAELSPAELNAGRSLAQRALIRDATVLTAVTSLGVIAQIEKRPARARRLFNYAAALSRRDLATQIWMIDERVAANDVSGALTYFDQALRTSTQAMSILSPILIAATDDADLVRPIIGVLNNNPKWKDDFLYNLIRNGKNTDNISNIIRVSGGNNHNGLMIRRLIKEKDYSLAWDVYSHFRKEKNVGLRWNNFERYGEIPPFDWLLESASGGAAWPSDGAPGGLQFSVDATSRVDLASQLVSLKPGKNVLRSVGVVTSGAGIPSLRWVVACVDGRSLSAVSPLKSEKGAGKFAFVGDVNVPESGCAWQWVRLRAEEAQRSEAEGLIEFVTVEAVR